MLKHDEAKFLDDVTIAELEEKLHVKVIPVNGIKELMEVVSEPV